MEIHAIDYNSARDLVIQKIVYTNHTLVAAGNQIFSTEMVSEYVDYYAQKMKITAKELLSAGLTADESGFSVTHFALNNSKRANGVSKLHSQLSEEQWPEYHWCNVTNGVHLPTWQDGQIANASDDGQLWHRHLELKHQLANFVQTQTGYSYDSNQLVLGWARRMAGYKQLPIIFQDLERLEGILKNHDRPVYLLVSGKVHQGDDNGRKMLQSVIQHMQGKLSGKVLFIPNYNLEIAAHLTRGVDVWLNTPEFGREACGTSGMKALSNGVLPLAVADGWSAEILPNDCGGWTLDHNRLADSLYELLEQTVVPMYYQQQNVDAASEWINRMKTALSYSNQVSASRMLDEYKEKLYNLN
jgi:glucan phosphorylase